RPSSEADSPTRSVASESRKPGAYAPTRSSGSLMLRTLHAPVREPEPAEVDSRIAGAPALEEAADRRVQHDAVELVASEEAMPTHCCVLRGDSLQRAVELPGEDDVDDVLLPHRQFGRDRVDDCHRPLEERRLDADLLVELAPERVGEALARVDAAAGQQPRLAPGLLVPDEQHAVVPAQDRGDADPWLVASAAGGPTAGSTRHTAARPRG